MIHFDVNSSVTPSTYICIFIYLVLPLRVYIHESNPNKVTNKKTNKQVFPGSITLAPFLIKKLFIMSIVTPYFYLKLEMKCNICF